MSDVYLLDTDILSNIRRGDRMDPTLRSFLQRAPSDKFYISVITLGEINKGIQQVAERDLPFATELTIWVGQLMHQYSERIVLFDLSCALEWGRLCSELPEAVVARNHTDILLAATANAKGLTMLTNNFKHFAGIPRLRLHSPTYGVP